jgi:hypothetical protein
MQVKRYQFARYFRINRQSIQNLLTRSQSKFVYMLREALKVFTANGLTGAKVKVTHAFWVCQTNVAKNQRRQNWSHCHLLGSRVWMRYFENSWKCSQNQEAVVRSHFSVSPKLRRAWQPLDVVISSILGKIWRRKLWHMAFLIVGETLWQVLLSPGAEDWSY